jgi:NADPH2:quinone reductase
MRPTLFNYIVTREEFTTYTKELFDWIEQGELNVKVHKVYKLEDVKQAHEDLEGRKTTGKLLLEI